jgi:DNA-binding NtrC family response regulator
MSAYATRLLLAHEEIETLGFIFSALVNEGFEVELATCGEEVLQALANHGFDVAVVSFEMLAGDAGRLQQALQRRYPRLPLVLLADDDLGEAGQAMADAGAFAYLIRPFDTLQLAALSQLAADQPVRARAQRAYAV